MFNQPTKAVKSNIFGLAALLFCATSYAQATLSDTEQAMIKWVDERSEQILQELKTHVEMNTGTANIEGLNRYRDMLAEDLREVGLETRTVSSDSFSVLSCKGGDVHIADHLVAHRHNRKGAKRILVNGHMDTVFSAEDDFQSLEILDDGTLKGPGVADMKGGIVIFVNALRAMYAQGLLDDIHLTVLLNSDEEIGSLGSRSLIEELAKEHDIGMIYEGTNSGLMAHSRKGLGQARIRVTGRESHSGSAHEDGVSANYELASKVIELEKLTDYDKKVTVNTGVMGGGEKRNTIPGCADAHIDMRFPNQTAGEALAEEVRAIGDKKHVSYAEFPDLPKSQTWAIIHRPAKPRHAEVDAMISDAMTLSAVIGEPIKGTRYSGGGTDGSIAQSVGLPTVDSLGMDGSDAHSSREQSSVASLIARTKLAAVMLSRQLQQ